MPDNMDEYSIQEAATKLGVPIHKLRRWDEQGVLVARRTSGAHRRYSREIIDSLAAAGLGEMAGNQTDELAAIKQALEDKRRIIHLLLESEHRYRDLVETSHDLIWATDANGRFTYLNGAAREIFGLPPTDLLGRCFFDFETQPSFIANRRFLAMLKRNGEVRNFVTHLIALDGRDRWLGINARISHSESGAVAGIRGTARDITDQHLASIKLEQLVENDQLTGLPNRVSLQRKLEQSMSAGHIGALLLLDIDHFKYVNERFGHKTGDQLLIGLGSALRNLLRDSDRRVHRLGGDEFAILLPQALRQEAIQVAEQALAAVRHYSIKAKGKRHLSNFTASIGIALYPFHGQDVVSLLGNVDLAMYQAKGGGRNRYVLFDQDGTAIRDTNRRLHWTRRLREALDNDRLVLYSQPAVRLADRKPVHREIFVRIRDVDGALLGPEQFVEIAESLRMIQDIDLAVVAKLLRHIETHGGRRAKRRYFVNLSQVSIADPRWLRALQRQLANSKVNPGQLVFELSEDAAMAEIDATAQFVRQIKEMGARFSLDAFSGGFTSFYYLKRFDIDYLKLDGALVRDLPADRGNAVFLKALGDIAGGLSRQVIAPCVETADVLAGLLDMGTRYAQGFLFERPTPLDPLPDQDKAARTSHAA
jgi:diguanylate cyclase (GGDEF)-like protein/PAS domain S-box-containing protein